MKTLIPDADIYSNYKLSLEEKKLQTGPGLKYYEYDVTNLVKYFVTFLRYLYHTFPLHWSIKEKHITSPRTFLEERQIGNEQTISNVSFPNKLE